MADKRFKLLNTIDSPKDLRKLASKELSKVCEELRCFIIDSVSNNPGHFGASLGVVELTTALHYAYNTPDDVLIWDVGHQAYAHKILTGRRDQFHTNRKLNGLSGFPKIDESPYDAFGVGHSSTSISAALGMAHAFKLQEKTENKIVAVIGDGALTGGMALEALNNASVKNPDILIILNDNKIAIDPNVGGMHEYLLKISTSDFYNRLKRWVWDGLGKFNFVGRKTRRTVQKIESSTKSFFLRQSNLFEALNIRYFGQVDGHNVEQLVRTLQKLRNIPGPKILHVNTIKGKGYTPAENDQIRFHAPGKFDVLTGEQVKKDTNGLPPKYQDVFGKTILELARTNDKIVGITPAMPTGCSLTFMMDEMPERVYDVGIAEQHAVTFSAGLAAKGMVPFCNIYSSFSQRAYDQIIHDVALQKLDVVFCFDRAGIVGADGPTHHGVFDMAFMNCIPNISIAAPMNEEELRNLMYTVQEGGCGPFVIRYPRGRGVMPDWQKPFKKIKVGEGQKLNSGDDIAVISIGHVGNFVTEALQKLEAEGIKVSHYNARFLKPIDPTMLDDVFRNHSKVITVEDGTILGGLGSAVIEFMSEHGYHAKVTRLGVPDKFIEHGGPEELHRICGYDKDAIYRTIKDQM